VSAQSQTSLLENSNTKDSAKTLVTTNLFVMAINRSWPCPLKIDDDVRETTCIHLQIL